MLLPLHRLAAAALALLTLAACGKTRENHRAAGETAAAATPSTASADATATAGSGSEAASDAHDIVVAVGDSMSAVTGPAPALVDELNRSFRSFFYQGADALADLFATAGAASSSMLCFPSALAYQAEYRRSHAQSFQALKDGSDKAADTPAVAAVDVRFIADFCKVDLKKGMTIPQGVGCISRLYTASAMKAVLPVIGQDAEWASFGMYPADTKSERRSVTPGDVRARLKADDSVVALLGAYVKDGDKMKRVKGHFVSLTGYRRTDGTPGDEASITVVDPSVDYAKRSDSFDVYIMAPTPAEMAGLLPEEAGYELKGLSLGVPSAVVLVESIIAFH